MSDTYTKLFRSITASSVWAEPHATRTVWTTLLAHCDKHGRVYASVGGLARLANATREETEAALRSFLSSDPDSRTKEFDGRRIEEIDGGWRLLNHAKYAAIRNAQERAEYKREWDRKNRPSGHARQSDSPTAVRQSPSIPTAPTPLDTNTIQKQDQEQSSVANAPPPPRQTRGQRLPANWQPTQATADWAEQERPDLDLAATLAHFCDHFAAAAGQNARKLDWDKAFRNWIRNERRQNGHATKESLPARMARLNGYHDLIGGLNDRPKNPSAVDIDGSYLRLGLGEPVRSDAK